MSSVSCTCPDYFKSSMSKSSPNWPIDGVVVAGKDWCKHIGAVFYQMAKFCEMKTSTAGAYHIFRMRGIDLYTLATQGVEVISLAVDEHACGAGTSSQPIELDYE